MSPSAGDRRDRPRAPTAAEARAEVEARSAEVRAIRQRQFDEAYGDRVPGGWIVVASWASTLVFTVAAVAAGIDPGSASGPSAGLQWFVSISLGYFVLGCAVFAVDLVLIAARSRESLMGIGGLFFLVGSAPRPIQWHLLGSFGAQVAVSLAAAAVRPFTPLAFGILAPTLGLAFCGLWAVRHGVFDPRRR